VREARKLSDLRILPLNHLIGGPVLMDDFDNLSEKLIGTDSPHVMLQTPKRHTDHGRCARHRGKPNT
jgi:hypothetical protein